MYHYRKTRKTYEHHNRSNKTGACPFPLCNVADTLQPILFENSTMYVIPNRVSYDLFEGREVLDHVMIIPKRHIESMKDFTKSEKVDAMTIAGEYEARGYNVYARGVGAITRSVRHQHTHLIKLTSRKPKAYFFLTKPHFLWKI
jgi:hypothetical protein